MRNAIRWMKIRKILYLGIAVAIAASFESIASAQQGGCQRGGMGSNGGPRMGMMNPNGFGAQPSGYMPGVMPGFNPEFMPGNSGGSANGAVAQSPAQTRQMLQANYQAKMERVRERKAAIKGANASRQKAKSSKPSSSSPTA